MLSVLTILSVLSELTVLSSVLTFLRVLAFLLTVLSRRKVENIPPSPPANLCQSGEALNFQRDVVFRQWKGEEEESDENSIHLVHLETCRQGWIKRTGGPG